MSESQLFDYLALLARPEGREVNLDAIRCGAALEVTQTRLAMAGALALEEGSPLGFFGVLFASGDWLAFALPVVPLPMLGPLLVAWLAPLGEGPPRPLPVALGIVLPVGEEAKVAARWARGEGKVPAGFADPGGLLELAEGALRAMALPLLPGDRCTSAS